MTYEQIEKEFDETFVNTLYSTQSDVQVNVWKLIDYGNGEHKIGHYYGPDEIKSFLKQSFIKYLQGEVKIIKEMEEDFSVNRHQVSGEVKKTQMLSKEKIIERLQAQIKELEV